MKVLAKEQLEEAVTSTSSDDDDGGNLKGRFRVGWAHEVFQSWFFFKNSDGLTNLGSVTQCLQAASSSCWALRTISAACVSSECAQAVSTARVPAVYGQIFIFEMNDVVARIQHAQSLAAELASLANEESNLSVPEEILDIVAQLSNRISAILTERRQKSAQIPKDAVITHLLTTNAGEFSCN